MLTKCVSHVFLALTQTRKITFKLYVQILTELGKYTWLGTYLLVLILILVLKRYVRTDERIINTMERNTRWLLELIHWRIFWSGTYRTIELTNDDIFTQKQKSSRHT